ncbi:hypothetical protein EMIT0158MI4_230002 [Burkholderia ambifaria]
MAQQRAQHAAAFRHGCRTDLVCREESGQPDGSVAARYGRRRTHGHARAQRLVTGRAVFLSGRKSCPATSLTPPDSSVGRPQPGRPHSERAIIYDRLHRFIRYADHIHTHTESIQP